MIKQYGPTFYENQLLAIIHGDAYVDKNENSQKARLDIYHKHTHEEYSLHKRDILNHLGIDHVMKVKEGKSLLKSGVPRLGNRIQSKFYSYIYDLDKESDTRVVERLVKPEALAILWQDDGTVSYHNKTFSSACLCTDGWEVGVLELFIKEFERIYGWKPFVMDYKCRDKIYKRLRFRKEQAVQLSNIIKDFIVPCMEYKLVKGAV